MPTGLTAKIYEGKKLTLREFALRCAKQFSPAHSYEGDLPLDKPPVLKGSDYYKLAINRANEKLTRLEHLREHIDEVKQIIEKERQDFIHREENRFKLLTELGQRYDAMIAEVEGWKVSEEYKYLKDFMLEQLRESKRFDCTKVHIQEPQQKSPEEWLNDNFKYVYEKLAYYQEEIDKKTEFYKEANKHLQGLYKAIEEYEKQNE